jgi:hypothetical protein
LHKVVKDGDKNKLQERRDFDERKPIFLYRNFKQKKKKKREGERERERERERLDLEEEDGKKTSQQTGP